MQEPMITPKQPSLSPRTLAETPVNEETIEGEETSSENGL